MLPPGEVKNNTLEHHRRNIFKKNLKQYKRNKEMELIILPEYLLKK